MDMNQKKNTESNGPDFTELEKKVNSPLWAQLTSYLEQAYGTSPKIEYSGCSMKPGWNVKYKKSGKSLCTLYPLDGYFTVLVVIGAKEKQEADFIIHTCSEYVQTVYSTTKEGMGQKWLMIDVRNPETVNDLKELIALRVKPKLPAS